MLEKESRIRETMMMMGLKQWTLWSTWYLKQFFFFMISVMTISILVKVNKKHEFYWNVCSYDAMFRLARSFRGVIFSYCSSFSVFLPSPWFPFAFLSGKD